MTRKSSDDSQSERHRVRDLKIESDDSQSERHRVRDLTIEREFDTRTCASGILIYENIALQEDKNKYVCYLHMKFVRNLLS